MPSPSSAIVGTSVCRAALRIRSTRGSLHRYSSSSAHITSSTGPLYSSSSSAPPARPTTPSTNRTYGQVLPHTHPHLFPQRRPFPFPSTPLVAADGTPLVAQGQLTPGIEAEEYRERRRKLMERLPEKSVVLVMAGRAKCMSANITYRFRQESTFWYLTGFQEPDAALILEADSSSQGYKMTMFVQPRDPVLEQWNGPRNGLDGAQEVFGADEAYAMEPSSLLAHLKAVFADYNHIYYDAPNVPTVPRPGRKSSFKDKFNVINFLQPPSPSGVDNLDRKADYEGFIKLIGDTSKVHALAPHTEALRAIKSDAELRIMKRAGDASAAGMRAVMRYAAPGRTEAQLQATFEHATALRGCQRPAYVPVVAGGANALMIHYISNEDMLREGELVCIDAGGEMDGYVSDITRAFPISGRFSSPQADLYSAVLRVLHSCTKLCTASNGITSAELHNRSVELLRTELRELGFDVNRSNIMNILYPHALGHWLGIDLHDTTTIPSNTRLQAGHVLTVEPALYIPFDDAYPKAFQGLGIRIEDDVAVRQDDNIILSAEAPREIKDVEAICSGFWDDAEYLVQQEREEGLLHPGHAQSRGSEHGAAASTS